MSKTLTRAEVIEMCLKRGQTQDEAEAQYEECYGNMDKWSLRTAASGPSLRIPVKKILRELYDSGETAPTARAVFEKMKSGGLYTAENANAIGDALGIGGLRLEVGKKVGNKKTYLIPDPESFHDWFDSDEVAPVKYYSDEYAKRLMATLLKPKKQK